MSDELALNEAPRWTVEAVVARDPRLYGKRKTSSDAHVIIRHELRYNGKRHEKGVTEREVERLREMARVFNLMGATPKHVRRNGDLQLDLFPELAPPPAKI